MKIRPGNCWPIVCAVPLLLPALIGLPRPVVSPAAPRIEGTVCTRGRPTAGARVRLKATELATLTDGRGRFTLPAASSGRITAWKEGYFIAGLPLSSGPLQLQLRPLPGRDDPSYAWVDPYPDPAREFACANCHRQIFQEWQASAHSRSAVGRHFRDLYGDGPGWSLSRQYEDGKGVCAACHAPALAPGDPAFLDLDRVRGQAARGVHCDFCHKVAGLHEGSFGTSHGRDLLKLLRPSQGQLFFGPLDDVDRDEDSFSPLYRDSRYCAACHEGVLFGVEVYRTFSEWKSSPAARAGVPCQDCHMKPTGMMTNIAPGRGGVERHPQTLASHRFLDGDRLTMLRRALKLEASARPTASGVRVEIQVQIEGVGHHLPTGLPDRQLLLLVEAKAGQRDAALLAGPRLSARVGVSVAGKPGELFARVLHNLEGHWPVPFWLGQGEVSDSALRPGEPRRLAWTFEPGVSAVRVRLIHRRFWEEVRLQKDWPSDELVVIDRWLVIR